MYRLVVMLLVLLTVALVGPAVGGENEIVRKVTIRAPRDMGYFAGDLVKADIDILVDQRYTLDESSLPQPGPVVYWLDLRTIDVVSRDAAGVDRRYTLHILYQNFYDALDARPQEIPTFLVTFVDGSKRISANVPAWTIGVSPLREIAPSIKNDPKDYLRADDPAPYGHASQFWWDAVVATLATIFSLALLARDRAWWPFQSRPARVFGKAARRLRALGRRAESSDGYLEALLVLHGGIDLTDGRRVLADDAEVFLDRHPMFKPSRDALTHFFAASRVAFFGSDPAQAREVLGFAALQTLARQLAVIERAIS